MSRKLTAEALAQQDAQARALAQREFRVPLALEAGAGTGKTGILTARIVSWCMTRGWEKADCELAATHREAWGGTSFQLELVAARVLRGVRAITFTEAASAEMASRVAKVLSELERGQAPLALDLDLMPSDPEVRRARARALLGSLDHLSVQTIHAFCLSILSRFPLEAGVHPHLEVDAEGLLLEEMARQVVETHLSTVGVEGPGEDLLVLFQAGIGPERILEGLMDLCQEGVPVEALAHDPFGSERLEGLQRSMQETLEDLVEAARSLNGAKGSPLTTHLLKTLDETREVVRLLESPTVEALQKTCEGIRRTWKDRELERLGEWASGAFNKTESKLLGDAAEAVRRHASLLHPWISHLRELNPVLFQKTRGLMAGLLQEMYSQMRSQGILSFGLILRWARDLLRQHPEVLSQVRASMDQLLVDEFQDTDSLQCEIIRMIALEGPPESRPGLFIVGDPKQSIYGWRDADLRAYDSFLEELSRKGGRRFFLSVNFRSVPKILEEVDRVMEQVMLRQEGLQPEFQSLLPSPQRCREAASESPPWSPVEYWVSVEPAQEKTASSKSTTKAQATELEARALAMDILELRAKAGVKWNEIGVLLRNTSDQEIYLKALKEAGIPYWVPSDKSFFKRREVLEAISLVCFVLDPTDQISMVSFLRSATVGVPDAAWIQLWSRGFPELMARLSGPDPEKMDQIRKVVFDVAKSLASSVPGLERIEGWHWSLLAAVDAVARLREWFLEEPLDVFVERLRELSSMEVTEAARYLGAFRVANLERFFRLFHRALEANPSSPQAALRVLKSAVGRQMELQEAIPSEALGEEAVQVMTIHRAKGLDFSHVYVLQAHKSMAGRPQQRTHVEHLEGGWESCLLGLPSLGYPEVQRRAKAVTKAEAVRTLYVAMTRARDRLVLAGNWVAGLSSWEENFASLMKRRLEGFQELGEAVSQLGAAGGPKEIKDPFGVPWRFPALWGRSPREEPAGEAGPARFRYRDLLSQARELGDLVSWAQSRQARAWQSPMSEESHLAMEESLGLGARAQAGGSNDRGREMAFLIGNTLHRALEMMDLEADPAVEFGRMRAWISRELGGLLTGQELDFALTRALGIWDGLSGGRIMAKLQEIRSHVVGRELPVLLSPEQSNEGPVGLWAGSMDLLYRDPRDGQWVVADYKTDHMVDAQDMAKLCQLYSYQGAHYVRAVKEMLALEGTPRFELWFLEADTIVEVDLKV